MSKKQAFINLLTYILATMEGIKDNPDREAFCVNFDENFKKRKERFKELTGKEWSE
jgi:hypothetical protein